MTVPYTIPWERQIHTRVYISRPDGVTWEDVRPHTKSISVSSGNVTRFGGRIAGIDGTAQHLDLVLHNSQDAKFNPQIKNSPWNQFNGEYAPLLDALREIQVITAVTAPGETPTDDDWIGLFHGEIGDNVQVTGAEITLSCRSLLLRLMEAYIEDPKEYGSEAGVPLETVMQQIIDDNLGAGQVELYCPEPTGFMIEPYAAENLQYKTVWDVLQNLASAHDFYLGDKWDPVTKRIRLTLLVPPRDKGAATADFVFNYRSDFYKEERDIRHTNIRNVIIGHYWDKAANEKRTITVKDDASISRYRRRAMEIEESATSLISTESEMLALLNGVLADLKDPQGNVHLDLPFFPQIDLFSGVVVHNPGISSTDDFMGVESYSHNLDFVGNKYRTELTGSGKIKGGQQKWLKVETRPGSPGQPSAPPTSNVSPANVAWFNCTFINDITLNWQPVSGAVAYEIRAENVNWGSNDGRIYRGNAVSHKVMPTQRTHTFYIKAINGAGLYSEDASEITLTLSAPSAPNQPAIESYFNSVKVTVTPLNNPAILGYYLYATIGDATERIPIPMQGGGSIAYPLESGTTVTIQVSAYDVIGEGAKSEPLQATTTALKDIDVPDELINRSKLSTDLTAEIDLAGTTASTALTQVSDLSGVVDTAKQRISDTEAGLADAEAEIANATLRLGGIDTEVEDAKARLSGVELRLTDADSEILDAKGRLLDAETNISANEADINDALEQLADVDLEIDGAKQRLLTAESDISGLDTRVESSETEIADARSRLALTETGLADAETRLLDAETDLTSLDGTVSSHVTKITNIEGELATKVSNLDFNALSGTVSDHSTSITQNATDIALKADQLEVDTISGTVTDNKSTLATHATQISAKVDQEIFDTLSSTVSSNSSELLLLANEISAKVSKTIFDTLEGRVTDNEGSLSVQAIEIASKVSQTVFDTLISRVTSAETSITQNATAISLKAEQAVVDALSGTVSANEAELLLLADEISSKVSQTVFNALEGTVSTQGTTLTQHAGKIAAKAEQSTVTALGDSLNSVTSDVAALTTSYQGITARVESFEGITDDLTGDVSNVTAKASALEIRAEGIESSVSSLETTTGNLGDEITSVESRVTQTESDISSTVSRVEATESSITAHDTRIEQTESGISAVVSDVSEIDDKVSANEASITAHSTAIELKANATDVYTKTEVDSELGEKVDVTTYTNKVGELEVSIEGVSARVENTEIDISGLEGEVGTVKADVANLDIKADGIESSVTRLRGQTAMLKPQNGKLWHFDNSLDSTDGIKPLSGAVATLRPNEGRFGGAVAVESTLSYQAGVGGDNVTVAVYRGATTWDDYADLTWTQLEAM